jgi:all-trans-retinol 13,14-reductase
VLGAGASGLSAAKALCSLGKKVVVIEQHSKAGGCLHTFKKRDFEFDTGFHYVGNEFLM